MYIIYYNDSISIAKFNSNFKFSILIGTSFPVDKQVKEVYHNSYDHE